MCVNSQHCCIRDMIRYNWKIFAFRQLLLLLLHLVNSFLSFFVFLLSHCLMRNCSSFVWLFSSSSANQFGWLEFAYLQYTGGASRWRCTDSTFVWDCGASLWENSHFVFHVDSSGLIVVGGSGGVGGSGCLSSFSIIPFNVQITFLCSDIYPFATACTRAAATAAVQPTACLGCIGTYLRICAMRIDTVLKLMKDAPIVSPLQNEQCKYSENVTQHCLCCRTLCVCCMCPVRGNECLSAWHLSTVSSPHNHFRHKFPFR